MPGVSMTVSLFFVSMLRKSHSSFVAASFGISNPFLRTSKIRTASVYIMSIYGIVFKTGNTSARTGRFYQRFNGMGRGMNFRIGRHITNNTASISRRCFTAVRNLYLTAVIASVNLAFTTSGNDSTGKSIGRSRACRG